MLGQSVLVGNSIGKVPFSYCYAGKTGIMRRDKHMYERRERSRERMTGMFVKTVRAAHLKTAGLLSLSLAAGAALLIWPQAGRRRGEPRPVHLLGCDHPLPLPFSGFGGVPGALGDQRGGRPSLGGLDAGPVRPAWLLCPGGF